MKLGFTLVRVFFGRVIINMCIKFIEEEVRKEEV